MRTLPFRAAALLLTACGGQPSTVAAPTALVLPDSTIVLDAATRVPIATTELLRRARAADYVLLGELHDNAIHHRVRGALITASGTHPAVVFEQFPLGDGPIPPPAAGEDREAWLDQRGFDRKNWRWPIHQPVVDAAIADGRSLWGSGVSREALRAVVRQGTDAAPAELRSLVAQSPLDSAARGAIERELIEGHCGKLPETMMPGMRAAQEVRDASMTRALLLAANSGTAWLIAGNGHVRRDMGVPRMLRNAAPGKRALVVGLVEREADGTVPVEATNRLYDVIILTPKAVRDDPCASL